MASKSQHSRYVPEVPFLLDAFTRKSCLFWALGGYLLQQQKYMLIMLPRFHVLISNNILIPYVTLDYSKSNVIYHNSAGTQELGTAHNFLFVVPFPHTISSKLPLITQYNSNLH